MLLIEDEELLRLADVFVRLPVDLRAETERVLLRDGARFLVLRVPVLDLPAPRLVPVAIKMGGKK